MGKENRNFDGDPHAAGGVWGPPSSMMNFCEEDYGFTWYVAEFVNATTNMAYIYPALRSMHARRRVDFMSASLLALGVGSFLYHASLRQGLQFVDDLSMMAAAGSMLRVTLNLGRTPRRRRLANDAALLATVLAFSASYVRTRNIVHHTVAFLAMVGALTARTRYLLRWLGPRGAFPAARTADWDARTWRCIGLASLGYLLWHLDLEFCAELRALRAQVGVPAAWLLELHGWWHLLTALGLSRFMDVAREMEEE